MCDVNSFVEQLKPKGCKRFCQQNWVQLLSYTQQETNTQAFKSIHQNWVQLLSYTQ